MDPDPVVAEVRKIRRQIEAEHGADFQSYYKHLLKVQRNLKKRLVRRQPKAAARLALPKR